MLRTALPLASGIVLGIASFASYAIYPSEGAAYASCVNVEPNACTSPGGAPQTMTGFTCIKTAHNIYRRQYGCFYSDNGRWTALPGTLWGSFQFPVERTCPYGPEVGAPDGCATAEKPDEEKASECCTN